LADVIEQTTDHTASTLESIEDVLVILDEEIEDISSTLDSVDSNMQEALDKAENIEDILEHIASTLDVIEDTALGVENALEDSINGIESSLDTIESIIDTLEDIESLVDEVTSQVESLGSGVDVVVSITDINESVVSIISSVIENIESVTEVIESKVDVESSLVDLIQSNVEILLAQSCTYLIYQADVDAGAGAYVITQPGTYCLAESIAGTIIINSGCVVLDLHNYVIRPVGDTVGVQINAASHIVVRNGWIKGGEGNGSSGVLVSGSSDVLIEDLYIIGMSFAGVFMDASECITVERCIIDDAPQTGIYFQGTHESAVSDCIIRGANQAVTLDSSTNNFISNTVFFDCTVTTNDIPGGANNLCNSCVSVGCAQGFSVGTNGVVRDSIVVSNTVGFLLQAIRAVTENNIAVNIGGLGMLITNDAQGTKGNYVSGSGAVSSVGIVDGTGNAKVLNNLVQNFDTNYDMIDPATIEFTPDETTRFWANLSRAQV
jgi:prefoldin subunit 5